MALVKNKGPSFCRNLGVREANGTYVAFLDADDFWYENHLSELKLLLESYPNCGMFTTAYHRKKNNKILKSKYNTIPNNPKWNGVLDNYFAACYIDNITSSSTVMIPKNTFKIIGFFFCIKKLFYMSQVTGDV